jgi:hypothetical protein
MNTDQLISHSRARFDHVSARRVIKEKYQAKMMFAHAGGLWHAGPELHSAIVNSGQTGSVVLLDMYETPIRVNLEELLKLSQSHWQEQMTAWLVEYEELNQKR